MGCIFLHGPHQDAPNFIITPHSAPLTMECTARVACEAANGIADYLEGRTPKSIYNKAGLKKWN